MFFLIKCAFWLGLVFYLMSWPASEAPAPARSAHDAKRAEKAEGARPRETGDPPAPAKAVASTLAQGAKDRLLQAARKHCLEDPGDCLSLLGAAAGAKSPSSQR